MDWTIDVFMFKTAVWMSAPFEMAGHYMGVAVLPGVASGFPCNDPWKLCGIGEVVYNRMTALCGMLYGIPVSCHGAGRFH
jgi:hypothetical protein